MSVFTDEKVRLREEHKDSPIVSRGQLWRGKEDKRVPGWRRSGELMFSGSPVMHSLGTRMTPPPSFTVAL